MKRGFLFEIVARQQSLGEIGWAVLNPNGLYASKNALLFLVCGPCPLRPLSFLPGDLVWGQIGVSDGLKLVSEPEPGLGSQTSEESLRLKLEGSWSLLHLFRLRSE